MGYSGLKIRRPDFQERESLQNQLFRLPVEVQKSRAKNYFETWHKSGRFNANQSILKVNERLAKLKISLSDNDNRIAEIAEIRTELARNIFKSGGVSATLRYVEELQIDLPTGKTEESRAARVLDCAWWERRLRTLQIRAQETIAREFGAVQKNNNVYVSNSAVSRIESRRQRSWDVLKTLDAVNVDDSNERLNMHDIAMKSIANPENRRNELMVRAAGFDDYCKLHHHVADFFTITCPSKYHAYHYYGKSNKKFEGYTPRQAQNYLVTLWACIRAKLSRENIQVYGLRVAEPHHDGTPHWHMLLYVRKRDRQCLRRIIRTYAIKSEYAELCDKSGKEIANVVKRRYLVEAIDFRRGSGASYIMKYISKNITGIQGESDNTDFESGTDSATTAGRVSIWASVWGIRQFQQIGGASITIWRELRMLRELEESGQGDLFKLWQAADGNEWRKFITLMGGADMPKSQQLAGLYKEIEEPQLIVNEDTGELIDLSLNKYGEEKTLIKGVESLDRILLTRCKKWVIEKALGVEHSPPRSSVNNCTV